jgi:hypothetical protein
MEREIVAVLGPQYRVLETRTMMEIRLLIVTSSVSNPSVLCALATLSDEQRCAAMSSDKQPVTAALSDERRG